MSISEQVKELRETAQKCKIGAYVAITNLVGIMNEAADTIESLSAKLQAANCGGWIPCEDRLPEDGVDVIVWFEYFRYGEYDRLFRKKGISYTYNGQWSGFVNGQSGWNQLRIIAWRPMPEDYHEP